MRTLNHAESSKKQKRSHSRDKSLLNEHSSGDDSQQKNASKKKKGLPVEESNIESVNKDVQPKKNKRKMCLEGGGDVNESVTESPQPKSKKKNSKDQEILPEVKEKEAIQQRKGKKRKRTTEEDGDANDNTQTKEKNKHEKTIAVEDESNTLKKKKKSKNGAQSLKVDDGDGGDKNPQPEKETKTENLVKCTLNYLHQWKSGEKSWKFSKYYQACLINFFNDPTIINEEDFETCLEYLKKSKGNALAKLKWKAKVVVEKYENSETKENGQTVEKNEKKGLEKKNKTAPQSDSQKNQNNDCILFVKNLPYGQTKAELKEGLQKLFTTTSDIRMPFSDKQKHIGFAFIEFKHPSEATSVLNEKQGAIFGGRPLYLDRVGNKDKSSQLKRGYKRESYSNEFVEAEKVKRAKRVIEMFG